MRSRSVLFDRARTLLSVGEEIRERIVDTACKNHAVPLSALSARNGDLGVVKKRYNK